MVYTLHHELGTRSAPLGDVRIPALAVWDAHLKQAKNNSGTLSFALSAKNPELPYLNSMRSEVVILDDRAEVWRGRVVNLEKNITGRCDVTVMGLMDYLHDTLAPIVTLTDTAGALIGALLSAHNEKPISSRKQIYPGTVDIDGTLTLDTSKSGGSTWDALSLLVKNYGGFIRTRRENGKTYLDWTQTLERTCKGVLEVGSTLASLQQTLDPTSLATVLYATGGTVDKTTVTLAAVNGGKDYVKDDEAVAAFGWLEALYKDSSITDAEQLLRAANAELHRRVDAVRSVRATAANGGRLCFPDPPEIGYKIRVRAPIYEIDELMPIEELDLWLFEPSKTSLVCCASLKTLSRLI